MLLGLWSLVTVVPLVGAILKFITPLKGTGTVMESLRVASPEDIAINDRHPFNLPIRGILGNFTVY